MRQEEGKRANPAGGRTGFTMAEALMVIGIVVVLAAAAIPSGFGAWRNVKQLHLNRNAETIFMTAQRNLAAEKVSGGTTPETGVLKKNDATDPNNVLPANTISPSLYAGNWVIQYSGWTVNQVYYSETESIGSWDATKWNTWKGGLSTTETGKVGWYGGSAP